MGYGYQPSGKRRSSSPGPVQGVLTLFSALEYGPAIPFVVMAVLFWLLTLISGIVNVIAISSAFQIEFFIACMAIPFFLLASPGFLLVIAYQEGRTIHAVREGVRRTFNNQDVFINDRVVMTVVMLVTLAVSGIAAVAQVLVNQSGIPGQVVWFFISVLSPFFCYASTRTIAGMMKIYTK